MKPTQEEILAAKRHAREALRIVTKWIERDAHSDPEVILNDIRCLIRKGK